MAFFIFNRLAKLLRRSCFVGHCYLDLRWLSLALAQSSTNFEDRGSSQTSKIVATIFKLEQSWQLRASKLDLQTKLQSLASAACDHLGASKVEGQALKLGLKVEFEARGGHGRSSLKLRIKIEL
ncbi:hypothetical protein NL676_017920 [Syzygium grande]|nr:hypothetical protein NL676_017920 [Syzygium grande]